MRNSRAIWDAVAEVSWVIQRIVGAAMPTTLNDGNVKDLIGLVRSGQTRYASGSGDNLTNPDFGAAGEPFIRLAAACCADGVSAPRTTILTPR